MKSTNTLTSLAFLKVNIDQGRDYLEYLRPFIFQVLVDHTPDPVKPEIVSKHILIQFGLDIPSQTIEIVLKRISKRYPLKKERGVYRITGDLPNPQITTKQSKAERHIEAIVQGLQEFSQDTPKPISMPNDAIDAICAFLAKFDITCVRAYLRGTTIPRLRGSHQTDIVLVSDYIQYLQQSDPERFDSFLILVQGHMLANALLCPDLKNVPRSYNKVTFYLDTPLLVQILGIDGESRQSASQALISLISKLGGKVAIFSHSRQELQSVLRGAAANLDSASGRSSIIYEARKRGTTVSDLLLIAESIDTKLSEAGIEVKDTPRYIEDFQIDEKVFEQVLEDEVLYHNPRAKEYDINSVRSIYVLREGKIATSLEKAHSIFVTSNSAFAKAAWEYGQQYEAFQEVSSIITDFSLANMAWLKAPVDVSSIPRTQLLALSYGALEPSSAFLGKYMTEIDRLESKGEITVQDHQILRSSPNVYRELMHLTLGNDASLNEETVIQTLDRVYDDIKKKESEEFTTEREAHLRTQEALNSQQIQNQRIISKLYWQYRRWANFLSYIPSVILGLVLVATNVYAGFGLRSTNPIVTWGIWVGSTVVVVMTLANLLFGSTVKGIHNWLRDRLEGWFLKYSAKSIGIDLSDFESID